MGTHTFKMDGFKAIELIDIYMSIDLKDTEEWVSPKVNINEDAPNRCMATCGYTGWTLGTFTGEYDTEGYPIFTNHVVLDGGYLAYIDWMELDNHITFCLSNYHCGCCPVKHVKIVGIENPDKDGEVFLYLKEKSDENKEG